MKFLRLYICTTVEDESILKFVGINDSMQRIQFKRNLEDSLKSAAEMLREKVGDLWKITKSKFKLVLA